MKTDKHALCLILLSLTLIGGCDAFSSEPTYGGLSIEGFNYTPYNLDRFVITDKYGNRAGGGGDLMPGSGEGSLSCCYKLKGTDFTVDWYVYDADLAIKAIHAQQPIQDIHKITQVHLPPTKVAGGAGERILGLHFYPDDHIEFEFRRDLSGTRIFYAEIDDWVVKKQGKTFDPHSGDDAAAFRRTARIASEGWIRYRLTNTQDLEQYVYYTLLVNPNFDKHPAIQKILAETKDKPGAFGAAMETLPAAIVMELKNDKFEHAPTGATHG
ncbi:hypothetical protein AYM40_20675 [Paraburkholderia phytofirmans OLGA172]|uniref:DUF3304 domain-containing protein n=1 Tax=Paraburkholderia phytofirmans OLGA172 TaxID=1417228 RepID=A0A160FQ59_9BURK|nr:DUF3304 domain-containing protein [Paraburkholderia phytofirmans]ANB74871.1 hypothetical protein AYM40_20675 [Paraburkholderia phytofirmans OLGA172]